MNEAWKGAPWVWPREREEKKRTELIGFLMDFLNGEIKKKNFKYETNGTANRIKRKDLIEHFF